LKIKLLHTMEATKSLVEAHKINNKKNRRKVFPQNKLLAFIVDHAIIKLTEKSHS
ncbi:hypothetical protein K501DRAFT_137173, partial [Backusella circina FSU 941]